MPSNLMMHIPLFCIAAPMTLSMLYPVIHHRDVCRKLSLTLYALIIAACVLLLMYLRTLPEHYFVYMAGRFPAPWGNELRAGYFEAVLGLTFSVVMFLSIWGGYENTYLKLPEEKGYVHYIMLNFLFASILALTFTNDLFTSYVFIEINTITACAIMIPKANGTSLGACMKYLMMSMLGSGLYLIAICYLYSITGHLLMQPMKESIAMLMQTGAYRVPLIASLAMFGVALSIKAGLWPFHTWFPDAYNYAPHDCSALLSGIVSKGYMVIFIKIIYRVYGPETFSALGLQPFMLILGAIAMLIGSVYAFMQSDVKKMVSFSSVAQMGYIFMGIGLNTQMGYAAAAFHIMFHALTKSMLFIATGNLVEKAGSSKMEDMRGMAYRCPVSAVAFWAGGLSMIGIPLFMGFISKLYFASAAFTAGHISILVVLGLSTCLNVLYFIPVMTKLYSKRNLTNVPIKRESEKLMTALPLVIFMGLNVALGLFQTPVMDLLVNGLKTLG